MQVRELLQQVDALKADIDRLRPLKPELEQRVLQKFRLDWNFNSNAIEGNRLTLGETKAFLSEGLTAEGKPFRDYLDIKGHNELIDFLFLLIQDTEPLTEACVRHMHKILLGEPYDTVTRSADGQSTKKRIQPGSCKETPNCVQTPTGETRFYCPPTEVSPRMDALLQWHRERQKRQDLHPVEHSALLHHRFLEIHPFDDGNGRMGRILLNLVLIQQGYPPVVIRVENRDVYILALRQADAGETGALVRFVARSLIDSEHLYLRGARGESIEDSNDLDKEVSLLKEELKPAVAPIELSPEVQETHFEDRLVPFFSRLDAKLQQFDDLFGRVELATRSQTLATAGSYQRRDESLALERPTLGLNLLALSQKRLLLTHFYLLFRWIGFLKAGTNDFSIEVPLILHYEDRKMRIQIDRANIDRTFLYGHWFSEDELQQTITAIAKVVLADIKAQLKPSSE